MLKNFLMKQMLKRQMKGVPDGEIDRFIALIEKNPEFFKKIAEEIQVKVKEGKDQMAATMEVMKSHDEELRGIVDSK